MKKISSVFTVSIYFILFLFSASGIAKEFCDFSDREENSKIYYESIIDFFNLDPDPFDRRLLLQAMVRTRPAGSTISYNLKLMCSTGWDGKNRFEHFYKILMDKCQSKGLEKKKALCCIGFMIEHELLSIEESCVEKRIAQAKDYYYKALPLPQAQANLLSLSYYLDDIVANVLPRGNRQNEDLLYQLGLLCSPKMNYAFLSYLKVKDYGISWLQAAAHKKHPDACCLLGYYYKLGVGVRVDEAQAYHYFDLAAQMGVSDAQYNLSIILLGQGRYKDAKKLLVCAANQNNKAALSALVKPSLEADTSDLDKSVMSESGEINPSGVMDYEKFCEKLHFHKAQLPLQPHFIGRGLHVLRSAKCCTPASQISSMRMCLRHSGKCYASHFAAFARVCRFIR